MLLIFDCDGVLVDSERLANASLAEMMTELGHAMTTEDAIRMFCGRSLRDVLDGIENTISGSAMVYNVDPVVTARAGFSPEEVELDASAILQGEPASTPVVTNDRSYTIRVRFPPETRATLDSIRDTMLISGTGKTATPAKRCC